MNRRSLSSAAFILLAMLPAFGGERVQGRYIVELTGDSVLEHLARQPRRTPLNSAVAESRHAGVRAEQQEFRARMERGTARVRDSVQTVANALIVDASEQEAGQLASLPGVRRVVPVHFRRLLLDHAVALHKIPEAWNVVGPERAGEGMKIAIIDTGVDSAHAGFSDTSLTVPDTYPKTNAASDLSFTSPKIIVARSYVSLLPYRDPDSSARDHVGHGTALAMIAAGARTAAPHATITGVAPRAFIGNYKVFGTPGFNDYTTDDAILKAIDDAVNDGMDVINLSLGEDLAPRLADDLDVQAVERASKAGVIVVAAAGNNGPGLNTMSSPATAASAIAVGASTNDRTFAASAEIAGLSPFIAIPGSGAAPAAPVAASIRDVAALDQNGLACTQLPAGGLSGSVALILRGTCTFEVKLNNAKSAGAVAALVFAAEDSPDPVTMSVGSASLPAEMISHADGVAIRQAIANQSSVFATLRFTREAVAVAGNRIAGFSAAGPNVDGGIKPDLLAVGTDFYTATQSLDARGDMYDPSGYLSAEGTSFSSPLVAGAAALVKSARPGLTVDQYRSLLINSASPAAQGTIQQTGAGVLNVEAALRSTITAYPVSLSLGSGSSDTTMTRMVWLTNIGKSPEIIQVLPQARGEGPVPAVSADPVELAPGASVELPVSWTGAGLSPGSHEGFLVVHGVTSGTEIRVPYWYAVESGTPASIKVLSILSSARRGSVQRDFVLFRILDSAGLALTGAEPEVTSVSGGGVVIGVTSHDSQVPGVYGLDVQLSTTPGGNVFRIQAGPVSVDVTISGV